jgi:putative oxidoreductase
VDLPPELAIPIGLLEVIGGIFLLVGVVTRIAAALFIVEMIGAIIPCKTTRRICRRLRIGVVVDSYSC